MKPAALVAALILATGGGAMPAMAIEGCDANAMRGAEEAILGHPIAADNATMARAAEQILKKGTAAEKKQLQDAAKKDGQTLNACAKRDIELLLEKLKPKPPLPIQAPFDPKSAAACVGDGSGRVEGDAFMRTRGGDVKVAAGSEVWLLARTLYTVELAEGLVSTPNADNAPPMVDPGLIALARTTQAGSRGDFSFDDLPACQYIVLTNIYWYAGSDRQGGWLWKAVDLSGGQDRKIILTR